MASHERTIHRKAKDYRWEGVDELPYKEDDRALFKSITRQVLFSDPQMHGELRYFEVAPGGFSTLERHEHMHAVLILRGRGQCLVGGEVKPIETRDLVTVPPMTWHQFRATTDEPLGFLCMVNAARDKPQLPTADGFGGAASRMPRIAAFLRNEPKRAPRDRPASGASTNAISFAPGRACDHRPRRPGRGVLAPRVRPTRRRQSSAHSSRSIVSWSRSTPPNSVGDTLRAAQAMAARLRGRRHSRRRHPGVSSSGPRKGNLVARLRGTGARRPLLLLAHLDVVEAKREDWEFDPFKLQEADGYFRGRGVIDDKAMAAIFVANLIGYVQEGFRPDRDIILALTTDEELRIRRTTACAGCCSTIAT